MHIDNGNMDLPRQRNNLPGISEGRPSRPGALYVV